MIGPYEMVVAFARIDPAVASLWRELDRQWSDDRDEAERRFVANLAHLLIVKLGQGDTRGFPAYFKVIEDCLQQGDVVVRRLMHFVLLADLQNPGLHLSTDPRLFEFWVSQRMMPAWCYAARTRSARESLRPLEIDAHIFNGV